MQKLPLEAPVILVRTPAEFRNALARLRELEAKPHGAVSRLEQFSLELAVARYSAQGSASPRSASL